MKRYNNFKCGGNEKSIFECSHNGPYPGGCRSAFPARLSCTSDQGQSCKPTLFLLCHYHCAFIIFFCSPDFILAVIYAVTIVSAVLLLILIVFLCHKKCKRPSYEKLETDLSKTIPSSSTKAHHQCQSSTIPPKYV